jgi:hypothetical protein
VSTRVILIDGKTYSLEHEGTMYKFYAGLSQKVPWAVAEILKGNPKFSVGETRVMNVHYPQKRYHGGK